MISDVGTQRAAFLRPHKGNLCRERFALKIVLEDKVVLYQHVKEHHRKGLFRFDDAKEERILNMPFMPNYAKFNSA